MWRSGTFFPSLGAPMGHPATSRGCFPQTSLPPLGYLVESLCTGVYNLWEREFGVLGSKCVYLGMLLVLPTISGSRALCARPVEHNVMCRDNQKILYQSSFLPHSFPQVLFGILGFSSTILRTAGGPSGWCGRSTRYVPICRTRRSDRALW